MLAPTLSSRPAIQTGSARLLSRRRATELACASCAPSIRTANSSPPRRASVSLGRSSDSKRSATTLSSWSPASWPRLSFTCLNPSRSTRSTASTAERPRGARERLVEPVAEERAVRQPGQPVVERLPGELLLEPHALGDVPRVEDDAADLPVRAKVGHMGLEVAPLAEAVQQPEDDLRRLPVRVRRVERARDRRDGRSRRTARPVARGPAGRASASRTRSRSGSRRRRTRARGRSTP